MANQLFLTGYDDDIYPVAEKELCGFREFFETWESYLLDNIIEYYQKVSGVKLSVVKRVVTNFERMIEVPPEIDLHYKAPNRRLMIDSESFIKNEVKNFKLENCSYVWNVYRESIENIKKSAKYDAFLMNPSGIMKENKTFYETPNLGKELRKVLIFKDYLLEDAQTKLLSVKQYFKKNEKEFVYVGIHSRRTDHLEFQTNKGNVLLKPSYYLGKIHFFTIQSSNIKADFLS